MILDLLLYNRNEGKYQIVWFIKSTEVYFQQFLTPSIGYGSDQIYSMQNVQ